MPESFEYRTPYGFYRGKLQASGEWGIGFRWKLPNQAAAAAIQSYEQTLQRLSQIEPAGLPRIRSIDLESQQFILVVSGQSNLTQLSQLHKPLAPGQVTTVVRHLANILERLHRASLSCFDLAPELIFVTAEGKDPVLIPSVLVALQPPSSAHSAMPFVAPEYGIPGGSAVDPVRSDVYSLGALAWFLLTGTIRKQSAVLLPGDVKPELAVWNSFIDGCCRTNPERRFGSIAEAVDALPRLNAFSERNEMQAEATSSNQATAPAGTETSRRTSIGGVFKRTYRKYRLRVLMLLILAVAAFIVVFVRRHTLAETYPQVMEPLVGYRRGYGETILKYADRSYSGAEWEQLHEIDEIRKAHDLPTGKLQVLKGWDSDTFYIAEDIHNGRTLIYRQFEGRWNLFARTDKSERGLNYFIFRLLERESLVAGIGSSLYRFTPGVSENLGTVLPESPYYWYLNNITVLNPNFAWIHLGERGGVNRWDGRTISEIIESDLEFAARPEANGQTLDEQWIANFSFTRTPRENHAIGVSDIKNERKVVEYKDGKWTDLAELPTYGGYAVHARIHWAWLTARGDDPHQLFLATDTGRVICYHFDGRTTESTVSPPSSKTSTNLILVWGVDESKYWTMDDNGTIWEFSAGTWREVVRGLHAEDVKFSMAWVSPTGTVIAITDHDVYRLR